MAQYQRQPEEHLEDHLWEMSPRRIARKREIERQPQTGPLPVVSIADYTSWYDYVDALERQRQVRQRMEDATRGQARHITNTLASIKPSRSFQRDTDKMSLVGIAEQSTVRMPAVSPSGERSRETKTTRMIDEIIPFLDHAIRLFIWQYDVTPTHIRLSEPNYLQLCQEYRRQISAYSNQRGTFHLILDSQLDDLTIVCEEHVLQQ